MGYNRLGAVYGCRRPSEDMNGRFCGTYTLIAAYNTYEYQDITTYVKLYLRGYVATLCRSLRMQSTER